MAEHPDYSFDSSHALERRTAAHAHMAICSKQRLHGVTRVQCVAADQYGGESMMWFWHLNAGRAAAAPHPCAPHATAHSACRVAMSDQSEYPLNARTPSSGDAPAEPSITQEMLSLLALRQRPLLRYTHSELQMHEC